MKKEDVILFMNNVQNTKKTRIDKIHDKIINCLSVEDLLYLKRYCSKHWYNNLYKFLWLDNFICKFK